MGNVLLYTKAGCVTARQVARALGVKARRVPFVYETPLPFTWGKKETADKLEHLVQMHNAGISVPPIIIRDMDMADCIGTPTGGADHTWVFRTTYHTRGEDAVIFRGTVTQAADRLYDFDEGYSHATMYIQPHREYRVHFFRGKKVFSQKKYFRQGLFDELMEDASPAKRKKLLKYKDFIRGNQYGWGFYDMKDEKNVPDSVVKMAAKAAKLINPKGPAGVDVIYTASGEPYVLEVNTAPALRAKNVKRYAEEICRQLGNFR